MGLHPDNPIKAKNIISGMFSSSMADWKLPAAAQHLKTISDFILLAQENIKVQSPTPL